MLTSDYSNVLSLYFNKVLQLTNYWQEQLSKLPSAGYPTHPESQIKPARTSPTDQFTEQISDPALLPQEREGKRAVSWMISSC